MLVTTKAVYEITTWKLLEWEGYEYFGPVGKLCSSPDPTAVALEKAQAAQVNIQNTDYNTAFAEQQQVLAQQSAKFNYLAANPLGYTPEQLATATTSINENTATAAKQAIGAAAAFAGAHGSADVGSGPIGEIAGQIGSEAAQTKAASLASLSQQNQGLKQQNFWNALQGLNSVGAEYGGSSGTAIGGSAAVANSSVDAGKLALASSQAGWQNTMGLISGIGGLALGGIHAGMGMASGGGGGIPTSPDEVSFMANSGAPSV